MSAQKSIRTGFLGVSHPHAEGRASVLAGLPELELAGFFEPDEEARRVFASTHEAPGFGDVECFFEEIAPELVIIEGPNRFNAEMARRATERGVAMLIEKPGAPDLEALRQVHDAVQAAGVFCQVGYHLRYAPSVEPVRALLAAGRLGRVTTARFHASVMAPWLTDPWFCDPDDRGGLVFLDFCHMLDLLILFLGRPTAVQARLLELRGVPEHPFEDSAALLLELGDVLAAGDCCGWEANDWIERWRIELYGTDGTVEMGLHPPFYQLYRREPIEDVPAGWSGYSHPSFGGEENYRRELQDVAARLRSDQPPGGATIGEALVVAEILEDVYRQNEER